MFSAVGVGEVQPAVGVHSRPATQEIEGDRWMKIAELQRLVEARDWTKDKDTVVGQIVNSELISRMEKMAAEEIAMEVGDAIQHAADKKKGKPEDFRRMRLDLMQASSGGHRGLVGYVTNLTMKAMGMGTGESVREKIEVGIDKLVEQDDLDDEEDDEEDDEDYSRDWFIGGEISSQEISTRDKVRSDVYGEFWVVRAGVVGDLWTSSDREDIKSGRGRGMKYAYVDAIQPNGRGKWYAVDWDRNTEYYTITDIEEAKHQPREAVESAINQLVK